jgi:Ice-binding-like
MSNPIRLKRAGRAGVALAVGLSFAAMPAAAHAAPVLLGTAAPFVVLGGQEVTNTGTSVLNGDLGVSPGTSLPGFQFAVVNGATHNNDGVAAQAQSDLTTAFNVAAAEPTNIGGDLSTQDLGGKTLLAGAYAFSSDAQLTGTVTFDAQGDSNAQFVVKVGTQLTTASASRVALAGGANPCNIYWKVDTAVLGTGTAFQGNILALTDVSLNNGASVMGRVLDRNGTVSLDNNVLNGSMCGTGSTPTGGTPTPTDGSTDAPADSGSGATPGARTPARRRPTRRTRRGTATVRPRPRAACTDGFRARVRGKMIRRVVFSLDGRRVASRRGRPFQVYVKAGAGRHLVRARVTFKDATRAKTLTMRYRACAAQVAQPRRGPSRFTG